MPACPALFVAAPASGQGKTLATAALARYHTRLGRRVRVFKCGPDFLDPMIHQVASQYPCYNLDLGMCGESDGAWRLAQAAANADLILVEGVMGLFDGRPSGADLARRFNLPVLAIINARAMAQTFGAIVHGLSTFQPELKFSGVLANHVGSPGHAQILRDSLPSGVQWYGHIPHTPQVQLPERHLGLFQPEEVEDFTGYLERIVGLLESTDAARLPEPTVFPNITPPEIAPLLSGSTIAIARDKAFNFIYPANLDTLKALGATLHFFSPLAGDPLPPCSALWLPGGYPELHGEALAGRQDLWAEIRQHAGQSKPILAECGGMAGLLEQLSDTGENRYRMGGILPGSMIMGPKLAALGTQTAHLAEGEIKAHTFHYSRWENPPAPQLYAEHRNGGPGEAIYRRQGIFASYLHLYFPSNPKAVARLLGG